MIPLYKPEENWNGILIVGERPSKDDLRRKRPFMSSQGLELARLLADKGVTLSECAQVYAYNDFPPLGDIKNVFGTKTKMKQEVGEWKEAEGSIISTKFFQHIINLHHAIKELKPKMIIPLGETPLFAVTMNRGIDAYRGSMLYWESQSEKIRIRVLPTHAPSRLFKQYHLRYLVSHDLERAISHINEDWNLPAEQYQLRPSFEQAVETLNMLIEKGKAGAHIAVDIETRLRRFISCIGFAWSAEEAICIPLINAGTDRGFYWTVEEEVEIVSLIKTLLELPTIRVSGQNYHYDAQYLAFHWGVRSHIWRDTMVTQHTFFSSEMTKDLNTISSMYCEGHVYWKDEGKGHEPTEEGEHDYWRYNCKDCCRTWEAAEVMETAIPTFEMQAPLGFQMRMWQNLFITMLRGVRYDQENRWTQKRAVEKRMHALECFMESLVPPSVHPRGKTRFFTSSPQLMKLFYKTLGIKPVTKRDSKTKKWKPTADDGALKILANREPVIKPLCEAIRAYRSLAVYNSTFLTPNPDSTDGRMRSGYKLSHPSTYRLASAGDVFDFGLNLQNLPKGDE